MSPSVHPTSCGRRNTPLSRTVTETFVAISARCPPNHAQRASGIAREGLQAQKSHPFGPCPFNDAAEEPVADPITPVLGSDMDLGDMETVRRINGLHVSHCRLRLVADNELGKIVDLVLCSGPEQHTTDPRTSSNRLMSQSQAQHSPGERVFGNVPRWRSPICRAPTC